MSPRAPALRPEDRRAQIVAAARPAVLEHGAAVTTRQIAAAAGVAEGTLFRAFADKESLLHAVVEDVLRPEPSLAALSDIDLDRPLPVVVREITTVMQERVRVIFDTLMAVRWMPAHAREPNPQFDPVMERIVGMLDHFADELSVAPAKAADVLRILIFAGTHPMINEGRELNARDISDVLLNGITRREGVPVNPP